MAANLLQLPDGDVQLLDFFVFLSAQPDDVTAARGQGAVQRYRSANAYGFKKHKAKSFRNKKWQETSSCKAVMETNQGSLHSTHACGCCAASMALLYRGVSLVHLRMQVT